MLELNKNHVSCPDLYNHVHYFNLINEATMEFAVGGGASVIFVGNCKYAIEEIEQNRQSNILFTHEMSLSDFEFESTNYAKQINPKELNIKKIRFFEEKGAFFFIDFRDMYNHPKDEDELPCIKFDSRIIFESDPLFLFEDQFQYSMYGRNNYPPSIHKRLPDNYYYMECTGQYKLKQLNDLGINWIKY